MNKQKTYQPSESRQSSKNTWAIIISVIITALVVGGAVYAWQKSKIKSTEKDLQQQISTIEKQLNSLKESKSTKNKQEDTSAVKKEDTSDWRLYEDKVAGFSLKYPKDVILDQNKQESLSLAIKSEKISSLNYPMNYNKATAEKDRQELIKGNYGDGPDWPLSASKKVRNLGSINGQEFMVLGRFEVCNVTFERKLVFYHNEHQTVITLYGNKDSIISNNLKYFKTDQANCGSNKMWSAGKQELFYQDLANKSLAGEAQNWFDLFDDIANTINIK